MCGNVDRRMKDEGGKKTMCEIPRTKVKPLAQTSTLVEHRECPEPRIVSKTAVVEPEKTDFVLATFLLT
jgi:hypothetical protein